MFRFMGRIRWRIRELPRLLLDQIKERLNYIKLCFSSITYNQHMNQSYFSDCMLEPIFWFVDNFTHLLGPFFVFAVAGLTTTVVFISYWVGLPFWWKKSPEITILLMIVGNWLLVNVVFHYYMAASTSPSYPPEGELIVEAISICKKCIAPKPPRTHHCSICTKCILKMDHHCPWLNNCVGYGNHRFFFLYMLYTAIGSLFIIIFGLEIGWRSIWLGEGDGWLETEPLFGHPVRFNISGHIIPVTEMEYSDNGLSPVNHDLPVPHMLSNSKAKHRAIVFMALINIAVVFALGGLSIWHGRLISRGETSIEAHINKSEAKRLKTLGKDYTNPYDFGRKKNWKLFLGLVRGRKLWRHVLLPSNHKPEGNGLTWYSVDTTAVNITHKDWP